MLQDNTTFTIFIRDNNDNNDNKQKQNKMSNMSYCRFHNTLIDLQDCKDVLENEEGITTLDEYGDKLSESEMRNAIELIEAAREIAYQFSDTDLEELKEQWQNLKTD